MNFDFEEDDSLALPAGLVPAMDQTSTSTSMVPGPADSTMRSGANSLNSNNSPLDFSLPHQSRPKAKVQLNKGLLSALSVKKTERSDLMGQKRITEEMLLAQQAQANLTSVDRMIQQQFLNTARDQSAVMQMEPDPKKKAKGPQKQHRFKLDWDPTQDYVVDQYSLQSGTMTSLLQGKDQFGNTKRHRPNPPSAGGGGGGGSGGGGGGSNMLVTLGMEADDEEVVVDQSVIDLHGNQVGAGSATYNLVTNTLGHSKLSSRQHLQQAQNHGISPANGAGVAGSAGAGNSSNNTGRNAGAIDFSLLPRNRALRNADSRPWHEKTLDEMTPRDWTILAEEFQMRTRGTNVPNPLRFWDDLNLYDVPISLLDAIAAMGYAHPTGIQRIAMPTALLNRDLIARAQTGSGKTCSFLVPVLTYITKQPVLTERTCMEGPYGVILAPARELATQIYDEAKKLTKFMSDSVNIACIIGGKREYSLNDRIELIVATPGRLDDLLEQRELVLNQCRYIVLDEADKMLNEGFEPQVNRILAAMPSAQNAAQQHNPSTAQQQQQAINPLSLQYQAPDQNSAMGGIYQDKRRRTMLYSATFSSRIEELARKYMQPDFVKVEVGDQTHKINADIDQIIEWCQPSEDAKIAQVCRYINQFPHSKVIIFCARKENCDNLCYRLENISRNSQRRGGGGDGRAHHFTHPIKPIVLHSDAADREANLRGFKDNDFNVLIATDVAGRGIDVKEVRLVINYELPDVKVELNDKTRYNPNIYNSVFEAYTHRVGRTGRAGQTGTAVTLITDRERPMIPLLRNFLVKNGVKSFPKQFTFFADSQGDNRPITL